MKKQVYNPFLPLDTYIPDGEPHVFGDRVYLFGSHDKEGGNTFCMLPYEIWSAPVGDLSDWTSKGINYRAEQDPLAAKENAYMYAPDCVQGNDGRYYLYYCLSGYKGNGGYSGPIGVAVCDTPDGKYEFYGHVRNADGTPLKRFVPFDPAVINDDGTIRLYYGTWYPFDELPRFTRPIMRRVQAGMFGKTVSEIKAEKSGVMGAVTCVLDDDMLTVKTQPKHILPYKTKGTPFESKIYPFGREGHQLYGHGFFEGSSIRKINGLYYFIYSSVNGHELCYATSRYPDRDFTYRGVIVSNGDVGFNGRKEKDRVNHTATNHGSIEKIGGEWYVFYHRQTHGSDYSRQACAERIQILPDGSIPQVEVTSCGLNGGSLKGVGTYPAAICCNITDGRMPHGGNKRFKHLPCVAFDGKDRCLVDLKKGTIVRYKYFDLTETKGIEITARGSGDILISCGDKKLGKIIVSGCEWKKYKADITGGFSKSIVSFTVQRGTVDILDFTLKGTLQR